MMKIYAFFAALLFLLPLPAQDTISYFAWDDPGAAATEATVGPNATTTSTSATVSAYGAEFGLNAGLPKQDLDFTIPNDGRFDVDGIEISFDYNRAENAGRLIDRGDNFIVGDAGFLFVFYQVSDGAGGSTVISSDSTAFTRDDTDATFENIRFRYDPNTGDGELFLDGTRVWLNDGPPNRPLVYDNLNTDILFATEIDGSGGNTVLFDNLLFEEIPLTPPPPPEVILFFDWEQGDPPISSVGPDAVSVGTGVVTKARLDGNGNGIAAPVTLDPPVDEEIDLILADDPIYDLDGIDLSVDYQADEGIYTIFSRNNFTFGENGINVTYRITEAGGGCSAPIVSTTTTLDATSDVYVNYRFRYDPNTGVASLTADGSPLWTNDEAGGATPGQTLCWEGDGDITVGLFMDGSDTGNALMDNLRIESVSFDESLPVELTHFEAIPSQDRVTLRWQTDGESDNDYFAVERAGSSGDDWREIDRRAGAGTTHLRQKYTMVDRSPLPGLSHYRLRQVDFDGTTSYSAIEAVTIAADQMKQAMLTPNPATDHLIVDHIRQATVAIIYSSSGQMVRRQEVAAGTDLRIAVDGLEAGLYFLALDEQTYRFVKR